MKQSSLIAITIIFSGIMLDFNFAFAQRVRLKDLTNIKGVRSNKLVGYGVVFGLAGTGDSAASVTSRETVAQMLTKLGVKSNPEQLASGNFASIIATAELPPFARSGDRINIRVSANGDATSLAGGTLLLTRLKAGDGRVYVVAQGPVVIGQADGVGPSVLTVATVPMGGLVEREFLPRLAPSGKLILSLKKADFTTNARVSHAINSHFKGFYAKSLDPASVKVQVPPQFRSRLVEFVAELESLTVVLDRKAVVVLNERTGTVVIGNDVSLGPVTIAHGDLSIKVIKPEEENTEDADHALLSLNKATVGDLVKSLNELGVKPKDLVGILQAIHAAGALQGEIVFI